ncbi:gliding motility-associated ABC transporter permease subunit GldF [Sediminitomix flava]|uniref:Protein involved in gliding motility GldF n=1 Tax=Sediminitomix flava TaxID=379075 RepID=A0A315Z9L2_SEDFL|nr:gliding motility-associated ABC transporter permease subunit GldF [Sediminitomix flava]PWJ41109.1 protein involved in gliding motility GldF [Sediminitomix flava]
MIQIFRKELSTYFSSLIAYVVMVVFLVTMGLFCWVFPQTSILGSAYANLDPLFSISPYIFMFLIPAITMRSFAEEKKAGTMELLFTRPLADFHIILGKYWAALILVLFALLPTLIYYYTVYQLGMPQGNLDTAAIIGSYIGLVFLSATFTAIGIFSSAITNNQIIAFLLAVFACFAIYDGISSLASINIWSGYSYTISQWGIDHHYQSVSKGLIDSRNILYFLSVITVMLSLTALTLGSRKWEK